MFQCELIAEDRFKEVAMIYWGGRLKEWRVSLYKMNSNQKRDNLIFWGVSKKWLSGFTF